MKFLLPIFLVFLASVTASAQIVIGQTRYLFAGTLEASVTATCSDSAGNLYIVGGAGTGTPYSFGQLLVEKLTPSGSLVWKAFFSLPPNMQCQTTLARVSPSGDVLIAGIATNQTNFQSSRLLLRYNSSGALVWKSIQIGAANASRLAVTGSVVCVSSNASITAYSLANGAQLWSQSYGQVGDIAADANNLFCIIDDADPNHVMRLNPATGATIWSTAAAPVNGLSPVNFSYLQVLTQGDLVVTGVGYRPYPYSNCMISHLSLSDGKYVFQKDYQPGPSSKSSSFLAPPAVDSAGNVYWTCRTDQNGSYVGKTMGDGSLAFVKSVVGLPEHIAPAANGGLFYTNLLGSPKFVQMGSSGEVLWSITPTTALTLQQGGLYSNGQNLLTYINTATDSLSNVSFGMLTLDASTKTVVTNTSSAPPGYIDNWIAATTQDPQGNSYVLGKQNYTLFVAKLNSIGSIIWRTPLGATDKTFVKANPFAIAYSPRGEVAISAGSNSSALIVGKLNAASGALTWLRAQNSTYQLTPSSGLAIDSNGNVDVASLTVSQNLVGAFQFASASGAVTWSYHGAGNVLAESLVVDTLNNVYLSNAYSTSTDNGFQMIKLSPAGALVFNKQYSTGANYLSDVGLAYDAPSNSLFAASGEGYPSGNIHALKIAASGVQQWNQTIPASGYGGLAYFSVVATPGGAGVNVLFNATNVVLAYKLNGSTGTAIWHNIMGGNSGYGATTQTMRLDRYNNLVVTGFESATSLSTVQPFTRKIDGATGVTRWTNLTQGLLSEPFDLPEGLTIGTDNEPIILGATSSIYGPGSEFSMFVKYANPPYCHNTSYAVKENNTLAPSGSIFAFDEDTAGASASVIAAPKHAASFTLNSNGTFSYTPVTGYVGSDLFVYKLVNQYGTSNYAAVNITVTQ